MIEQRSPEWFEQRKGRVTASIVGAILNLSPYMDRADAMRAMVRAREGAESEFKGNIATDYGTRNEDGARIEYEMESGHDVEAAPFVPFEDWAGASPDGFVDKDGLLEIKCPYGLRKEPAPVPFKKLVDQPHYAAQVQFQLYCTGRKWCHFYQWSPNGSKMEVVDYDPEWAAINIPILRQFHAEFLDEPADDHIGPARVVIDTPDAYKMIAEWDELNEQLERAAERKKDLLAEFVKLAGEKNALIAGRKLTMTERSGSISYAKAVKALLPNADLKPYTGKSTTFWQVR